MAGYDVTSQQGSLHVLQITNHGMHEWDMTPGLPDTGGQNVYVNAMTDAMVRLGHRVTIVNRGGYPNPVTGGPRIGTTHRHGNRARIVYLTDGVPAFVRKEDMAERIPALADELTCLLERDGFDLIVSHYWDGALLGVTANRRLDAPLPHVWVPHSLGAVKRRNVDETRWADLRIGERIDHERAVLEEVDAVVATSDVIRRSLSDDYGVTADLLIPPGVDPARYRPRGDDECPGMWEYLAETLGRPVEEVAGRPVVIEVSRTDTTKRKDVLLEAFAATRQHVPDALLALTIDETDGALRDRLLEQIGDLGLVDDVVVLGSVWDRLPCLYAMSAAYCTPSVMEGFGMSAAEAAASGLPVIASDLVPFAVEYLLGGEPVSVPVPGTPGLLVGDAGIVAPADSVEAFAAALTMVLTDRALASRLGTAARAVVIPALTWDHLTAGLLHRIAVRAGPPGE